MHYTFQVGKFYRVSGLEDKWFKVISRESMSLELKEIPKILEEEKPILHLHCVIFNETSANKTNEWEYVTLYKIQDGGKLFDLRLYATSERVSGTYEWLPLAAKAVEAIATVKDVVAREAVPVRNVFE